MGEQVSFYWHKNYPKGILEEINPNQYQSIVEVIEEATKKFSNLTSFSNMGEGLTFEQVSKYSDDFASFLQNELQLKKGDRIAIQMPNLLQYPIVLFGALKAGLIVVNTNPLYTVKEMEHQFKDSGIKAIVILANFAVNLEKILPHFPHIGIVVTEIGDMFKPAKKILVNAVIKYVKKMVPKFSLPGAYNLNEALSIGAKRKYKKVDIKSEDIAFLQYTGGTTGVSKGAILTNRNIIANMLQAKEWMAPLLRDGQEKVITALPLYHIFSLTVNCLIFMQKGAENILITNPKDIPGFIKELKKHKFTVITGVNTLFNALMNNSKFSEIDFKNAKLAVAGAMALQKAVAEKWKTKTGIPVIEGYGLTEASPIVCCNPVGGGDQVGTVGMPVPSTEVKLLDDDGKEVAMGQPGELCVKGPQVMQGYWNRQDETDKVIINGWLHTGDIAVSDAVGFFKIVDRKKDMIIVSGFNVYPNEIEDVVATHPGVLEVAAVGIPDEHSGESVKLFIVKRDPNLKEQDVMDFCKDKLTNYKRPRSIEWRKELPKTNVGKILRRELRK
jgi:long-chain acyl-CoA synthetase